MLCRGLVHPLRSCDDVLWKFHGICIDLCVVDDDVDDAGDGGEGEEEEEEEEEAEDCNIVDWRWLQAQAVDFTEDIVLHHGCGLAFSATAIAACQFAGLGPEGMPLPTYSCVCTCAHVPVYLCACACARGCLAPLACAVNLFVAMGAVSLPL